MDLWFIAAASFVLGLVMVGLLARSRPGPAGECAVTEAAVVFAVYIVATGCLVAFNLFQLDRIDPFFTTARWYVFAVLYWPSWVLTFAPSLILGSLAPVGLGLERARRMTALGVLLVAVCIALEALFLLRTGVAGIAVVQAALIIAFTAAAFSASRARRPTESGAGEQ